MTSPYDIIRKLVEKIILPKYPFLKLKDIDSYALTNYTEYDVRFLTSEPLESDVQMEIDTEVKTLFKMVGLDNVERYTKNKICVWFKQPRQKDWTFKSAPGYEHT